MPAWETYLREHQQEYLDQFLDLLTIPSISALPEHAPDVARAAEWTAARLRAAGVEGVQVLPTGVNPAVYGAWEHAAGRPTILVYGHFDVQPVDPLNLWTTRPFEPAVRDGRVYARGASDMKGNLVLVLAAVEALLRTEGRLPVNLKFLFEGQEELGSPRLPEFVAQRRDLLRCDSVVSVDGMQWSPTEGSLVVGLRGMVKAYIDIRGASSDLHSGLFGGAIQNPLHAMAELLASFHTPDGRVAVAGFYDDVVELSPEERKRLNAAPFDEKAYLAELGAHELFGEPGYTTLERVGIRPTLEINGMWGGFTGEGTKTVLPNEAHAKISCRLVPNQEPTKIWERIREHVRRHAPKAVEVRASTDEAMAWPYSVPADDPANQAAAAVLTELYGKEPFLLWEGGSVPVCEIFRRELGAYTVSFGFGLPDEHFHAPDEFMRLASFERGQRAVCMLLARLGS